MEITTKSGEKKLSIEQLKLHAFGYIDGAQLPNIVAMTAPSSEYAVNYNDKMNDSELTVTDATTTSMTVSTTTTSSTNSPALRQPSSELEVRGRHQQRNADQLHDEHKLKSSDASVSEMMTSVSDRTCEDMTSAVASSTENVQPISNENDSLTQPKSRDVGDLEALDGKFPDKSQQTPASNSNHPSLDGNSVVSLIQNTTSSCAIEKNCISEADHERQMRNVDLIREFIAQADIISGNIAAVVDSEYLSLPASSRSTVRPSCAWSTPAHCSSSRTTTELRDVALSHKPNTTSSTWSAAQSESSRKQLTEVSSSKRASEYDKATNSSSRRLLNESNIADHIIAKYTQQTSDVDLAATESRTGAWNYNITSRPTSSAESHTYRPFNCLEPSTGAYQLISPLRDYGTTPADTTTVVRRVTSPRSTVDWFDNIEEQQRHKRCSDWSRDRDERHHGHMVSCSSSVPDVTRYPSSSALKSLTSDKTRLASKTKVRFSDELERERTDRRHTVVVLASQRRVTQPRSHLDTSPVRYTVPLPSSRHSYSPSGGSCLYQSADAVVSPHRYTTSNTLCSPALATDQQSVKRETDRCKRLDGLSDTALQITSSRSDNIPQAAGATNDQVEFLVLRTGDIVKRSQAASSTTRPIVASCVNTDRR